MIYQHIPLFKNYSPPFTLLLSSLSICLISMLFTTILSALTMALCASGSPVELSRRYNIVNHDSLNPIPTRVEAGVIGRAMKIFTPLLHIAHGCQPYTAADDNGNIR